jgi:fucose permease
MTGSTSLLITTLSSAFFAGVLLELLRNLAGPLAEHLGTTDGRIQRLRAAFSLFLIPMMLVTGLLIDKWGLQPVLIGGSLLAGLGITSLEPSRTNRSALPGVLLTAAAAAALTTASLVLMPRAFAPTNVTAAANLGCIALALGVLLTPGLMNWLTRHCGFRRGLLLLALAGLIPAACGLVLAGSELETAHAAAGSVSILRHPALWLAAGILFLYQPLQEALGGLARRSLKELHVPERSITLWVGGLWLAFLAARLLTGLVIRPGYEAWLVLFLIMLAGVTLGNLIGNDRPTGGGLALLLMAACLAPVFPTVLGLVLRTFPGEAGSACGVLMAADTLGVLVFPSLVHPASERHGPRMAMRLALGFTLVLVCVALVLALVQ